MIDIFGEKNTQDYQYGWCGWAVQTDELTRTMLSWIVVFLLYLLKWDCSFLFWKKMRLSRELSSVGKDNV